MRRVEAKRWHAGVPDLGDLQLLDLRFTKLTLPLVTPLLGCTPRPNCRQQHLSPRLCTDIVQPNSE